MMCTTVCMVHNSGKLCEMRVDVSSPFHGFQSFTTTGRKIDPRDHTGFDIPGDDDTCTIRICGYFCRYSLLISWAFNRDQADLVAKLCIREELPYNSTLAASFHHQTLRGGCQVLLATCWCS